ncbi:hypothetical protein MAC_07534 [Metarhizium acridum CQMa 102]|uniref:Uncharacterized protein n=1 Tax=Metarhizium acridum (strain CQMa 102) TaxID=655827 RepID=E9ECD6_METAQ|nr:uncharacterized protein MAC_07534 [Metarhizium acridum CQMa 102]EFY86389.1 hypothetical protein MAC_07534 [Metarhizium acridum CQMa 102]
MLFYGLDPTPKAFTLFIHQTSVICASYQAVLIREDDETVVLAGDAHNPRFRYPGMLERLLEAKYGQNFAVKAGDGIVAIYINADTFYNRPKRDSCYANSLGIFGPAREHECDASTGEKLLREYTAAQERASRRCRAVEGWTEAQAPSARSLSNESSVPENVTAPFVLKQRERLRPSPFEQRMYMRALVREVVRDGDMGELDARNRKLGTRRSLGNLKTCS